MLTPNNVKIQCEPETSYISKLIYEDIEVVIDTTVTKIPTKVLPNGNMDMSLYDRPFNEIIADLIAQYHNV